MAYKYRNKILDELIVYFMKTILHLQSSGIEDLPLANHFDVPIHDFLELSVEMITDAQMPEVSDLVLNAECNRILSSETISAETALHLQLIKELSQHIHYDNDYYEYLLSISNLWDHKACEYAMKTFYPNLPEEMKDRYHIYDLIKYLPQELLKINDF